MQMVRGSSSGGVVRNYNGCSDSGTINESCAKRSVHPQTHKNDITVPTNAGAESRLFSADDEYLGISDIVSDICSSEGNITTISQAQDEHRSKGKELFFFGDDWPPQLDSFVDFQADLIRDFDSTFEMIGSDNCFEDPLWSSIRSPDAQLVPSSSHFDNNPKNLSAVASESTASVAPTLKPSVSAPDTVEPAVFLDQINLANPINIHQPPSIIEARETCTDEEIEHFPVHSSSDGDLFCPFSNMLVPTSSTMMCSDHEIASSSTCNSGPDHQLVAAYARTDEPTTKKYSHDPSSHATPDMILDGMAANPLEMYFPALTTACEQLQLQPEQLMMSGDSLAEETHHQLFPDQDFAVAGDVVLKKNSISADLQDLFSSEGRTTCSGVVPENTRSPLIILEAVPVKHLGFRKLQEGMNQLDVETKTCIRDALYRLANDVEQRHCVTQLAGGSSAGVNRLRSSVWTEAQASPMDRSVAQLLLQKPPYRTTTTTGCQAKHAAR